MDGRGSRVLAAMGGAFFWVVVETACYYYVLHRCMHTRGQNRLRAAHTAKYYVNQSEKGWAHGQECVQVRSRQPTLR